MITDTTPPRTMRPVQNGHNVEQILDGAKGLLDMFDLRLAACPYPAGSQAHRQVEQAVSAMRDILAHTRKYGHLYRKVGD